MSPDGDEPSEPLAAPIRSTRTARRRPLRKLRRWYRRTPTGEIAGTVAVGIVLVAILAAAVVIFVLT